MPPYAPQLPWPERFLVQMKLIGGSEVTHHVTTWLHENKAIALVIAEHIRASGPLEGDNRIYDLQVKTLGPAPQDSDGTAIVTEGDIIDRFEW